MTRFALALLTASLLAGCPAGTPQPIGTIAGRVVDPSGAPVAGAQLKASSAQYDQTPAVGAAAYTLAAIDYESQLATTTTGADGRFDLPALSSPVNVVMRDASIRSGWRLLKADVAVSAGGSTDLGTLTTPRR